MSAAEKFSHKIIKRIRVHIPDAPGAFRKLAAEIKKHGGIVGASAGAGRAARRVVRDIVVYCDNDAHVSKVVAAMRSLKGCMIVSIEDEILRIHRGGKIAVTPTVRLDTLRDLRMVYTPGVAQVCNHIVRHPEAAREYTWIGNTVCIATNGTAVLGLGDIGVLAGMPVMEGKSVILNKMAGINCVPLLIDSRDPDVVVEAIAGVAKTFGAIMIEDIAAPACFEIEDRLQAQLDMPVFHDDQHGTATVILAALIKAMRMVGKKKESVRIVMSGAGAAATATAYMLLEYGFCDITACDREGVIYAGRKNGMNPAKAALARRTNKRRIKGALADALAGADIFIGLSAPQCVTQAMVRTMRPRPIVFALANPVPEIWTHDAIAAGAAIALDGRSINNALIFPGLMRGALDARARRITYAMKFAAAETLASLAAKREVVADFMDLAIHKKIAASVIKAAFKDPKALVPRRAATEART